MVVLGSFCEESTGKEKNTEKEVKTKRELEGWFGGSTTILCENKEEEIEERDKSEEE